MTKVWRKKTAHWPPSLEFLCGGLLLPLESRGLWKDEGQMISEIFVDFKRPDSYLCCFTEKSIILEHRNEINKPYNHAYSKFYSFSHSYVVFKCSRTVFHFSGLLCTDNGFLPGAEAEFFQHTDLDLKEKLCFETPPNFCICLKVVFLHLSFTE